MIRTSIKTVAALGVAGVLAGAAAVQAAPVQSYFEGQAFTQINWENGTAVAVDALGADGTLDVGDTFRVYFSAKLSSFQGIAGDPLNGREITVVAGYTQQVYHVNDMPGNQGQTAYFTLVNDNTNFLQVYVDNSPNADYATGEGFNDGDLILSGRPSQGDWSQNQFTASYTNQNALAENQPGVISATGGGTVGVYAENIWFDENYFAFDPNIVNGLLLAAFTDGSINLLPSGQSSYAFNGPVASQYFNGTTLVDVNFGTFNGLPLPGVASDFVFQAHVATAFEVQGTPAIPEPATAALGLIGLAGLAIGSRRRR